MGDILKIPKVVSVLILLAISSVGCATSSNSSDACARPAPTIQATPSQVAPNEPFQLRGEGFSVIVTCNDTGGGVDGESQGNQSEAQQNISIEFRQGSKTWDLATVDANQSFAFNTELRVPAKAEPGEAVVATDGGYTLVEEPMSVLKAGGHPTTQPEGGAVSDTARVACGEDGTQVLTPKVEARPDGVHFVIDNRFESNPGFSVRYSDGGTGGNTPVGKSEHVGLFPPGTVEIGCHEPLPGGDFGEPDYGRLEVTDKDDSHKPTRLECASGERVSGASSFGSSSQAGGAAGEEKSPVELTRSRFSERIRGDYVVELAGYPEARGERTVRVVRDGRVLATAHYYRAEGGGWLGDSIERCAEFSPSGN
jgi:hypothetical protein